MGLHEDLMCGPPSLFSFSLGMCFHLPEKHYSMLKEQYCMCMSLPHGVKLVKVINDVLLHENT